MTIKIRFLGGADVVGRMAALMDAGGRSIMVEYGMSPTKPPSYPLPAPKVDYAFLTHCHLDHSGMIPWLVSRYDNDVFTNPLTAEISEMLMYDSLKIAKAEGYPEPYNESDIERTMGNVIPMEFGDVIEVGELGVHMHSGGHIPGAMMFEFIDDGRSTLYTGDIHTINTRLVAAAKPSKCDNLIIEGTYGGRLHPDRKKTEKEFLEKVKEVIERGGKVLIPCFAVGRTQEIMMLLNGTPYDKWLDGMGRSISKVYMQYPEYLLNPNALRVARRSFNEVKRPQMRSKARKGEIIVTTGGMLDGGPVLNYIKNVKDDPLSAILITGYQAEDTNGRMLLEKGSMNIDGNIEKINCEVQRYDFSAHADHEQLIRFIHACDPENIMIMHSEHREPLFEDLSGDYNVILPELERTYEL